MGVQNASRKRTIFSWEELINALKQPARYPRFPELTRGGTWNKWVPNPKSKPRKTSSVEQPPWARSWSRAKKYLPFYRPLKYTKLPQGCIRLLDLREARIVGDILIGFKLIITPISAAPTYEAISYCWGSTDLCTGIFVSTPGRGEQVYRVTENLASCLHSLITSERPDGKRPDFIWVDQICVNQEDVHELNTQVRRMSEIYKTAAGVTVWLGQKSDFELENCNLTPESDPDMDWCGAKLSDWVLEWSVFARPWFYRTWVFQEAVFAQQVLVLLGSAYTTWEDVSDLAASFLGFEDADYYNEHGIHFVTPAHMVKLIEETKASIAQGETLDLARLLWMLDQNECQNPRDKVFSLTGFTGDLLPADFVDYEQPTAVIMERCTRYMIENKQSIDCMAYLNPDLSQRTPSWVPVWHATLRSGMTRYATYSASAGRVWKAGSRVIENELEVSGRLVDTIFAEARSFGEGMELHFSQEELGTLFHDAYLEAWNHMTHVRRQDSEHRQAQEDSQEETALPQMEHLALEPSPEFFDLFFRTVFAGEEVEESDCRDLIQLPDDAGDDSKRIKRRWQFAKLLEWGLFSRGRLFVLRSGRLGFARDPGQGPKPGDYIAILHGLSTPCILRRSKDGRGWVFVTDIYVDDFMYGDAVDWEEDEADTFTLV